MVYHIVPRKWGPSSDPQVACHWSGVAVAFLGRVRRLDSASSEAALRRVCLILAFSLALIGALSACAKKSFVVVPKFGPYTLVRSWGAIGTGDGQFQGPTDVAIGPSGGLYVTDTWNHRIQVFDEAGRYLFQWGDSGSASGQFRFPIQLAIDSDGNVYVADADNQRIEKFASDGTYLLQWGSPGSGDGQFLEPEGVAVDASGNVYVADRGNRRMQKFGPDGTYLRQWGRPGTGDGSFVWPCSVAVDDSGYVYVVDREGPSEMVNRVQKFTSDGAFVSTWGRYGHGPGQFYDPMDVAVDSNGTVYVGDSMNERVQTFTRAGAYLTTCLPLHEREGYGALPTGIAVRPDGTFYVAVRSNGRIQEFSPRE